MAQTKELAAFEEAAHGLAFMEAGVPLMYLRVNHNGSGECEPMPGPSITREQNLFISDVGCIGQELCGVFDAEPSDVDCRRALEAMPYINSRIHRAAMLRWARTWVWANESEISTLATRVLETPAGFLGNEAIGALCRAKNSPLSRFASLYPAPAPKTAAKPSSARLAAADRLFDKLLANVKPARTASVTTHYGLMG